MKGLMIMFETSKKNKFESGLIVGIFILIITLIAYYICHALRLGTMSIVIALIFSIGSAWASYYYSDKIVLSLNKARPATKGEDQKLVNILNIILFGLSIIFTFIWLMTYSNSSTINVFLTLSSIAAIFSTFYLLSQGISLLFLLLNKDKKIDKKLLIAYIMLSVLAFILFITNWVYFSDFVTIKSFLR